MSDRYLSANRQDSEELESHAHASGMRRSTKYISNRFLTLTENLLLGAKLSEYHTRYRAFSRTVLETLPLEQNSDDFVFDNQMLAQAIDLGFAIGEITCPTAYFPDASSINFRRSCIYGLGVLRTALTFRLHRMGVIRSKLFQRT